MTKSNFLTVIFSPLIFILLGTAASALDLSGAWTTGGECEKIFTKTDNGISFRPDSEMYGSGFIIQGDNIRGRAIRCTIKSRNDKGVMRRLNAICASDIMIDRVQIDYKVVDENKIIRVLKGTPGFEVPFTRCGSVN